MHLGVTSLPGVSRWIGYSLAAALMAGFALLAWSYLRPTSIEGVRVPRVLVNVTVQRLIDELQTPASTAARLSAELKRARVVPGREALLGRIDASATEIDRLGVQGRDLQILDLLTPEPAGTSLPNPQREALTQVLALVRSPGYMDGHTDRRVSAASSLGMFESEAGLLALVGVLEDPGEPRYLRQAVADSLEQLQDFRAVRAVERYRAAQPGAEFGQVEPEIPLASSSRSVRRRAIETLGGTQDPSATRLLLQALDDPDAELRALAIKKLRGREDERIRPALVGLLSRERERSPLYFAIDALRGDGGPDVVDALLRAYRSLPAQRTLLIGALAGCDDTRVVAPLLEALHDPDGALRFEAQQGLASLAARQPGMVIEPLILVLHSKAPLEVKRKAAELLGRSTGQNFGLDIAAWDDWYRFGRR
jgi:HEAT repeat protein